MRKEYLVVDESLIEWRDNFAARKDGLPRDENHFLSSTIPITDPSQKHKSHT